MSLTKQARKLFTNRHSAAKWVRAMRYLRERNLIAYRHLPMAGRIVS